LSPLEEFGQGARVDAAGAVGIGAFGRGRQSRRAGHGVGLAAPGLAVRENTHVVAVEDRRDEGGHFGVDLFRERRNLKKNKKKTTKIEKVEGRRRRRRRMRAEWVDNKEESQCSFKRRGRITRNKNNNDNNNRCNTQ